MKNTLRNIALALCCASMVYLTGCTSISPGNVGIEVSKAGSSRGVQDVALRTGWVFYNPMWTSVIEYPTYMQTVKWTKNPDEGKSADESITFTTKDSSTVNTDVSVSYQLDYAKVPDFYVRFRADEIEKFTDGFMRNVTRDAFNEAAGNYTVEQVMGDNAPLLKDVRKLVQSQLTQYGVTVEQLGFIGAPRPPDSVNNAINLKVQAQQIALQKGIEVTQAEADARKNEAYAEGDAKANVIRATADATANKLRAESLTPALVQWTAIQKWNGARPQVEGAGSGLIVSVK
jgi:regulator of protease activity HflC (stomatin/prohibitin superfamily)